MAMHQHRRKTKNFRHGSVHNGKNNDPQADEFLVFGYSAKLHNPRDEHTSTDDHQQPFDESLYLIPWNGDDRLKIDRYDVRLYLSSLDDFDEETQRKGPVNAIGPDEDEEDTAEKLEEELCEEERFLDLYEDIRRREQEEANQKRGKGAEIGFTYEEGNIENEMVGECEETTADDEQPYEQPPSLKLPLGIVTPETVKQNALIERTAQFVVAQGPQMEVVIKAKQRQNAEQFGFLDFDHRLHPYYKYMCKLIREKKYVPQPKQQLKRKKIVKEPSESESDTDTENEGEGYLHPSLLGAMSKTKTDKANSSPQPPGFIGPSPRPPPQKAERKQNSPGPDLDVLVQQFHRSSSTNSLYSSLLKGLHSVLPGTSAKIESVEKCEAEPQQSGSIESTPKPYPTDTPSLIEVDQQQHAEDYNKWHMEFYGRPSPFLPGPPPACQRPVPDSVVESAISVAAKYVALHGAYAEQRLIEHNQDKVHFLQARSPYYTFYQSQVRQIQWKIIQQSQQNRQQPTHAPTLFTTTFGTVTAVPSPPPLSSIELVTVPNQQTIADAMEIADGTEPKEAEPDSKQLERREKARLFMEKILNERMAEKHRTKTNNRPNKEENKHEALSEIAANSAAASSAAPPFPSSTLSPLVLSKAISSLIDEQIKRSLGTSPPQSAEERKRKRERRRDDEERRRTKKKRRTRSYSSESSSSSTSASSSSTTASNEEGRSRKRRKRRSSKKRKRRQEHESESVSSDNGAEEEQRRRRRKRRHKREKDSFSHRRRHRHRSRSRSPRR